MTFCIAHDTKILICVWFEFDIPSYVDGLGAPKNIALIYCDAGTYRNQELYYPALIESAHHGHRSSLRYCL